MSLISIEAKITRFFRDFDIIREYDSDNLETAFTIITEEWNKLEYDYKRTAAQNKKKIPMYKEICKYLEQEDILEEDRQAYTRELYNCVNVFVLYVQVEIDLLSLNLQNLRDMVLSQLI